MKEMARYGFILATICLVASGLLATVNSFTYPRIIALAKAEEEASLKEVFPRAVNFEPVKSAEELLYYKAVDEHSNLIGIVFKSLGKGYSSSIETLVGMTPEGTITAIKILNHNETPGLGARITEKPFTGQFVSKSSLRLNEVQAITGATISSKAVIDSVKKRAEEIIKLIQDGK